MIVPVTTVPNPFTENTLSTFNLAGRLVFFSSTSSVIISSSLIRSSIPLLDKESTFMTLDPSRKVPTRPSFMSSSASSSISSSTISHLVITTKPFFIFKYESISICSIVCGIMPSSAATTKTHISRPDAPASIFFINFS